MTGVLLIPDHIWISDNTVYASGIAAQDWSTALQQFGVVNAAGEIANPTAFDEWLHKTQLPEIGQDSAMEACFDES